jgi:hypothetical protein
MQPRGSNTVKLEAWFRSHVGVTTTAAEVCEATGIPNNSFSSALKGAVSHLQIQKPSNYTYRFTGQTYDSQPEPSPTPVPKKAVSILFETVSESNGRYLLRDENGDLFRAEKLDW